MTFFRTWMRRTSPLVGGAAAWFIHPTKGAERRARAKSIGRSMYLRGRDWVARRRANASARSRASSHRHRSFDRSAKHGPSLS